jgi:hypothetical protein
MAAPSPRRRLQFRLRTLMIGVTLLAVPLGYLGWQAKIARVRESLLESKRRFVQRIVEFGTIDDSLGIITSLKRWPGDRRYREILLSDETPDDSVLELRSAFPEAVIARMTEFRRFIESAGSATTSTAATNP